MVSFGENIKAQLVMFVNEWRLENPDLTAEEQLRTLLDYGGWSARRATAEVDEGEQCEGRRWQGWEETKGKYVGGVGSRCMRAKSGGGCYCKKHQRQADATCVPCQFWTDTDTLPPKTKVGDKKGLFYGRYDEALPFSDGEHIVTIWNVVEVLEKIGEEMAGGMTYHPCTKEGKANKTAAPRIPGTKKATKSKKKPVPKSKAAIHRWMADGNRKKVKDAIIKMHDATGKFPPCTHTLLLDNNLDVEAAVKVFNAYGEDEWKTFCGENSFTNDKWGVDELGNMTAGLKSRAIMGEIQKTLHSIWKKLPQAEQQPYIDMKEAADKILAETSDETPTPHEEKKPKKTKKTKKSKKIEVVTPPQEDSDSDSDADEEDDEPLTCISFTMGTGDIVYLDESTNMAYTMNGEELGEVNKKTKTFC